MKLADAVLAITTAEVIFLKAMADQNSVDMVLEKHTVETKIVLAKAVAYTNTTYDLFILAKGVAKDAEKAYAIAAKEEDELTDAYAIDIACACISGKGVCKIAEDLHGKGE